MATEKKAMCPMTHKEYVDGFGAICPFCKSENIGKVTEFNGNMVAGEAWHTAKCFQCGRQWAVHYGLTGYSMNVDPQNVKIKASSNFVAHLFAIRQQLDELSTMVNDHFGYSTDEIHWGHTGTVQHIYEQLTEIMASLDGFVKK